MSDARQRQTYYGAVSMMTKERHLKEFSKGDSDSTIAYVRSLQEIYADKKFGYYGIMLLIIALKLSKILFPKRIKI